MTEPSLQDEQDEDVVKYLMQSQGYPVPEEKYNVHLFLHRVATELNTTKVANLKEEEIGIPKYPVRTLKDIALISEKIIGNSFYEDYFKKSAEILTSTSLSKEGFLVRQATTSTRQIADVSKKKAENKGWFKKKEKENNDE